MGATEIIDQMVAAITAEHKHITKDQIIDFFNEGAAHYSDQMHKSWETRDQRLSAVRAMQIAMDEDVNERIEAASKTEHPVSCKRGCAACCHIYVDTSKAEAELIHEACLQDGIPIDIEYLKKQAEYTDKKQYNNGEFRRCHFLTANNDCGIYEYRPLVCRKYLVASDPKFCDASKYPGQEVMFMFAHNVEMMAMGMIKANQPDNGGTLPKMLLKVIEEHERKQNKP